MSATSSTATATSDDNNAVGAGAGVPRSQRSAAASSSSARALRDAALCDVLLRLQLTAEPLRAFARYANVHASTSDADVAALFGCAPDGALGSAPRFFVALQHHQLVLFASSAGASGSGGALPQANIDLLGCRVEYGVLALGMIVITDAAKNRHLMFLDNANAVDEWVVALRDATYQHGMRPPSSIGAWLEVQFADGDSAQAAEATVAASAAPATAAAERRRQRSAGRRSARRVAPLVLAAAAAAAHVPRL
jgi:hypothetical protein